MIFATFSWLVIARVALVRGEEIEYSPHLQAIRSDLFELLADYTPISLAQNTTEPNVYFFPIAEKLRVYMGQMQFYYQSNASRYITRDRALEIPYALAPILDDLEQSPNAKFTLKVGIFYDKKYMSENYVNDAQSHYNVDRYESSFYDSASERERVARKIVRWTLINTKGRQLISRTGTQMIDRIASQMDIVSFVGCWEMPKVAIDFTDWVQVGTTTVVTRIKSFSVRDKVGYYNNADRRFEAIRIPFEKSEFVMAIVLPYRNQSLDFLAKFKKEDYRELFRKINATYEHIFYTIPFLNHEFFSVNEKGANIFGEKAPFCDSVPDSSTENYDMNAIHFKLFVANKPFAAFIYHDKTGIILTTFIVKNITSSSWIQPRLVVRMDGFKVASILKKPN